MKYAGPTWFVFVLLSQPLAAQTIEYKRVEVTQDVHVFIPSERGVGNSVAVIGHAQVMVVDTTATPSGARHIIAEIRKLTSKPVRHVANTHWHDDHIWGNQAFRAAFPDAEIIAHRYTLQDMLDQAVPGLDRNIAGIRKKLEERDAMLQKGIDEKGQPLSEERRTFFGQRQTLFREMLQQLQNITPTPPTLTFERDLVLHYGDLEIRLLHLGKGHTRGDVVVHIPERGILVAGDLITYPIPAGSYVVERIETMKKLAALDARVIIPGHGPVMTDKKYLLLLTSLLETLVAQVRQALDRGLSADDTYKAINGEALRATLGDAQTVPALPFERFFLRPAVEQAYAELKNSRCSPVDVPDGS